MRISLKWFRIASFVSMALMPVGGAFAVTLGRPAPAPSGPIQVEPAPPLNPPPSPEVCLQRFQRRLNDCNILFPCGWYAVAECYENLRLCDEAAREKYDNCIDRAFPTLSE